MAHLRQWFPNVSWSRTICGSRTVNMYHLVPGKVNVPNITRSKLWKTRIDTNATCRQWLWESIITRATNILSKNLKFWLYDLQILTLFWPIDFLRLQLQNTSTLGVKVNPEAYTCSVCFDILKYLVVKLWGWYIDKYINNYSRVKPENIM